MESNIENNTERINNGPNRASTCKQAIKSNFIFAYK